MPDLAAWSPIDQCPMQTAVNGCAFARGWHMSFRDQVLL